MDLILNLKPYQWLNIVWSINNSMFSKNSTDLDWLDKLLSFCINKKGFIEFGDDVNPLFIIYAVKNKTIENDFLIVSEIEKCPKYRSKLHRDGKDKFEINNATSVYKQKYQCSDDECNHNLQPLWEDYFKPGSNYTERIKDLMLELRLIYNNHINKLLKFFICLQDVKLCEIQPTNFVMKKSMNPSLKKKKKCNK